MAYLRIPNRLIYFQRTLNRVPHCRPSSCPSYRTIKVKGFQESRQNWSYTGMCREAGGARLVRGRLRGSSNEGGGTRWATTVLFVGCGVVWGEGVPPPCLGFTLLSQNTWTASWITCKLKAVMITPLHHTTSEEQILSPLRAAVRFVTYPWAYNNNNNNIYWLQLGRHPVAVVI
jgi:hypothetical protein